MRGLEPPPGLPDTDLNRARLPIPPHPRAGRRYRRCRYCSGAVGAVAAGQAPPLRRDASATSAERFASLVAVVCTPLSSRGLGRRPLMAETRVRIPVAVLSRAPIWGLSHLRGRASVD